MTKAYSQAYLLKRRVKNEELWLEGIYVANAFQTVIGNAFGKHKLKYLAKPLDIYEKTEAEKEQEIRRKRQEWIDWLNQFKKTADNKQGVTDDGKLGNT